MTTILDASNLTLADVDRLFKFEERTDHAVTSLLALKPLTEIEQQETLNIRRVFREYYAEAKISEGEVKFLTLAPLMWLAGFYQAGIKIILEEKIATISIQDEDTNINGRMDILAVSKSPEKSTTPLLWVLVIETKNSSVEALEGLPQLLTYAHKSLEQQPFVWGLTTNGMRYQFVYIEQGNPSTYQLLPILSLLETEMASQILQTLKAICQQFN